MKSLLGLFVDDGMLALALLVVVAMAAVVARIAPGAPLAAGLVLLLGCVGALYVNVLFAR
jgi:hypothetical protein